MLNCEYITYGQYETEINKYLAKLKKVMSKSDFDLINQSQIAWQNSEKHNQLLINKFIKNNQDNIAVRIKKSIKNNRIGFLNIVYFVYYKGDHLSDDSDD